MKLGLRLSENIRENISKIKKSYAISRIFIWVQNLTAFNQNRPVYSVHRLLLEKNVLNIKEKNQRDVGQ